MSIFTFNLGECLTFLLPKFKLLLKGVDVSKIYFVTSTIFCGKQKTRFVVFFENIILRVASKRHICPSYLSQKKPFESDDVNTWFDDVIIFNFFCKFFAIFNIFGRFFFQNIFQTPHYHHKAFT